MSLTAAPGLPVEFDAGPAGNARHAAARFTLDGSDELEHRLARTCAQVVAGVSQVVPPCRLEALLLGGGYGRGEGGVFKTESGDRPYNDLEFYVLVRGSTWLNERCFGGGLDRLAHELTAEAGVEVEFKIISAAKLRRSPPTMFYYDLVMGHRRLLGDGAALDGCEHHRIAGSIPLSEAARLLMNRCTGLLLARERLGRNPFTVSDADFVGRNLAKAQLAFGDAVLAAYGTYHWSCLERHERLRQCPAEVIPWLEELRRHHEAGLKFKLHPHQSRSPSPELLARHEKVAGFALEVWLWLESWRLGRVFTSPRDYALDPLDKCPGTNAWRNRLVNAKILGPGALFSKRSRRHPRERVFNALALLLWEASSLNPEMEAWLVEELGGTVGAGAEPAKTYGELWRRLK